MVQTLPRYTSALLAFCLSVLMSLSLSPLLGVTGYNQIDFWLLCLLCSALFALPLTILELALAKRAKAVPLQGMMQLTRDADVSTRWRLLAWGALLMLPFAAGAMIQFAGHLLSDLSLSANYQWLMILVLCVVAFGVSLLPQLIVLGLMVVGTATAISLGFVTTPSPHWVLTSVEWSEWSKVMVLSIVGAGAGLGLYWHEQAGLHAIQERTSQRALPIWIAQIAGLAVYAVLQGRLSHQFQAWALILGTVGLAGLLLQMARAQLTARQVPLALQALILLVPILIWAIPTGSAFLYRLLIIFGLLLALGYAIFAAWRMKISHLRKSINFSSEAVYNLWRVLMRVALPLAMLIAVWGWLSGWIVRG